MYSSHAVHRLFAFALGLLMMNAMVPVRLGLAGDSRAESSGEYEVKAALVYNFLKFVEWPAGPGNADAGGAMRLCILGSAPEQAPFDALQGREIMSRQVAVEHPIGPRELDGCQVVFITAAYARNIPAVLEGIRTKGILTVGDTEGYARDGVMINMFIEKKRVRFEINAEAARTAGIRISTKLLRLASRVYGAAVTEVQE